MNNQQSSSPRVMVFLAGLLFSFNLLAGTPDTPSLIVTNAGQLSLKVTDRPITEVLAAFQEAYGSDFRIDDTLGQELVRLDIQADNWKDLLRQALKGFNWIEQTGAGEQQVIFVLERGTANAIPITDSVTEINAGSAEHAVPSLPADQPPLPVPAELAALPAEAVSPYSLDFRQLRDMDLGDRVHLTLPGGGYDVIMDDLDNDEASETWIGHLDGEDETYRVIITAGEDGIYAHIYTPQGLQTLETLDGRTWWVDVATSGLAHLSQSGDTLSLPTTPALDNGPDLSSDLADVDIYADAGARKKGKGKKRRASRSKRQKAKATKIDLVIAYTPGMKRKKTRMRHLVALANAAFADSRVAVRLRLKALVPVKYAEGNDNSIALQDLTYSQKGLSRISQLRQRYKADLVSLVRPFRYPAQASCGIAWLGGANGSTFHPITGFSVVSDGRSGGYYCTDYTFAHEIGHNLGSAHDRANAGAAGAYQFSYGFGLSGKAGSIMSYINPEVGRFSSPNYKCRKIKCGRGNANNARSINLSRRKVAAYK